MSDGDEDSPIREGLVAWTRGDLDALERVLDPAVTLRAAQPGPWDCDNRDQVMGLLRQRAAERQGEPSPEVDAHRLDGSTFSVSGLGGGDAVATLVKLGGGKVISLQQVSTDPADPNADAAVAAIRSGDVAVLAEVLTEAPDLARACARLSRQNTAARRDGLARLSAQRARGCPGPDRAWSRSEPPRRGRQDGETPLHLAASSDDVDAARALLDGGADAEAPDG